LRSAFALSTLAAALALGWAPSAAGSESPRAELLQRALAAYRQVEAAGLVHNRLLTVVDYRLPSSQRRLWILDPDSWTVRLHEFVAHGRGSADPSDPAALCASATTRRSRQGSSLGTFTARSRLQGHHGYSLELFGLDPRSERSRLGAPHRDPAAST
jgi:hypothetical protein